MSSPLGRYCLIQPIRLRLIGKILVVAALFVYLSMVLLSSLTVLQSCKDSSTCFSAFIDGLNNLTFSILLSGNWLAFGLMGSLLVGCVLIVYSHRATGLSVFLGCVYPWFSLLAVAFVFWVVTYLVEIFDFGQGFNRALVLLVVLFAIPALVRLVPNNFHFSTPRRVRFLLALLVIVFLTWHILMFYQNFLQPNLIDIATTTLEAGQVMLAGKNPYTIPLDPQHGPYVYGPLMAVVFLPLGQMWGASGVVATNLLLDIVASILIFFLGSRSGKSSGGLYSALLYLITPFVTLEIFTMGSTDLAAVVPLLAALFLIERKKGLTGLCVGLSISAKLAPGAFLAVCCLPKSSRRRYIGGMIIGLLPTIAFFAMSPVSFGSNVILFPATREIDSTSWMYGLTWSPEYRLVTPMALLITLLIVGVYVWFRDASLRQRCGMAVACIVVAMLSGPVMHRNYQLWWLPFFAVVVAAAIFPKKHQCPPLLNENTDQTIKH